MPKGSNFSRVDRAIVTVGDAFAESDEKEFWMRKSPIERFEAVEFLRKIAYGRDATTARLQRVIETAEFSLR